MEKGQIFALALIFGLVGCATGSSRSVRQASFVEAEYAPYREKGTASISGQAFLRTRGGDVKLGAGLTVVMHPVTSYSTEWFERYVIRGKSIEDLDPRAASYVRETIADGEGRFRFNNLPAGEYYLSCYIRWFITATRISGGWAYGKASVASGEHAEAVVTR